ncbi:MAG: lipopolysaccharide biosynthesis protein [Verrucomicrobiae bacterium]|nr:lipopolysaccharide biosynthesis protein [Verrucomicrobiae bacterium]
MNHESKHAESQGHRNRSIRLAVLTSILSKFGTVLLRLISIPIAIRVLGMEEFGVYAAITTVVSMIDMMHVGIGPALTQGIAKALAKGDREREQGVFATAVILSAGLTLAASFGLAMLVSLLPITTLFGENFAPFADSMRRACWIAIAIVTVELICVVVERARDGYQETRYNNAWGAAGNFLGAAGLIIGVKLMPTVEFLVLALNGSIAIVKLANTIHMLVGRPYLWPKLSRFRRFLVKPLLFDGARFSVTYLLSAAVEYNAIAYLIGRLIGPEKVGLYNVMITVHFSLTGFIHMVTIPLWPAIVDAHSRGDAPWIRKSAHRIQLMGPAFGFLAAIGMVAFGPWAFPLWIGEDFSLGRPTLAVFGAYFTLHLWRHVNQVLLLGIGEVNYAVKVVIVESLTVLAVATMALSHGATLFGVYSGIAVCLALLSAWLYPLRFRKSMASWERDGVSPCADLRTPEDLSGSSLDREGDPNSQLQAGAI